MTLTNAAQWQQHYLVDAIVTASPARRLTMLYDAIELDLRRADAAFEAGDIEAINDNLVHAQEIILTLRDTMRPEVWEGAAQLIALHNYFLGELLGANLDKDRARVAVVAPLIASIGNAWRQAAAVVSAGEEERVDAVG